MPHLSAKPFIASNEKSACAAKCLKSLKELDGLRNYFILALCFLILKHDELFHELINAEVL